MIRSVGVSRSNWDKSDRISYYREILSSFFGLLRGFGSSTTFYFNVDKLRGHLESSLALCIDLSI